MAPPFYLENSIQVKRSFQKYYDNDISLHFEVLSQSGSNRRAEHLKKREVLKIA